MEQARRMHRWPRLPAAASRLLFVFVAWLGLAAAAQAQTAITLSPCCLADGVVGEPYTETLSASGGAGPYTFDIATGSLPPGLVLDTAGNITGTPSAAGTYGFLARATDSVGVPGTANYSIEVFVPPSIDPPTLPGAVVGEDYSQQLTVLNAFGLYTFSVLEGTLPTGLALSTGGLLAGVPEASGDFTFTVIATPVLLVDGGLSGPAQRAAVVPLGGITVAYTVAVAPVVTVSPATVPGATAHVPYSATFSASGGSAPYTFTIDTPPPGLSLAPTGTLSGTPSTDGAFPFNVTATDALGVIGTTSYTLAVALPTIIVSPAVLPDGLTGVAYDETLSASGGLSPYTFAVLGSLPDGLVMDPGTGIISGTPTSGGSFAFSVLATDADGHTATLGYDVSIAQPVISVSPAGLPDATAHAPYSANFSASGGSAPYTFTIDTPPPGLSLAPGGLLGGTPSTDGSFPFNVVVTDAFGATASASYTLLIGPPTIVVAPATLPGGTAGVAYAATVGASGGLAPYVYAVLGSLPDGLSMDAASGAISGTPTATGSFAFSVQATDADGHVATQAYAIAISADPPVAVADVANTPSQQAVSIAVTANDTGTIDSIAVSGAPSNGNASVQGLEVVYTPAGTWFGDDSFSYVATGPSGSSAPATVTVHVSPLAVPVGVPQSLDVLAGASLTFDAANGASGGPITAVTITQAPAQGTAAVAGTQVTYTAPASASGTQSVAYVLSNAYGDSAPVVSTIAIDARPIAATLHASTPMGIPVDVDLASGASGGPFTAAALGAVTPASAGSATLQDDGDGVFRLHFAPAASFTGEASVEFTLSNANATSEPAEVVIAVDAREDPTLDPQVGGIIRAQVLTVRIFAHTQITNVQQRLETLHDPSEDPWGFWVAGTIRHGDRDGNGAVPPAAFETSGVTSGADYRFSDRFAFGGALGHGSDRTAIGDEGARSDARAESAMGYASFKPTLPFYVDGLAGHQRITFQLQRVDPATGEVIATPRDGVQSYSSWSSGYEHKAETWMIGAYGRMDVAQANLDAYEEQGSPLQALAFEEQSIQTRTSTLGLRGRFQHKIRWGTLVPKFRIEFQRDFHDASGAVVRYADQGDGPAYVVSGEGFDRNRAIIELGGVLRTIGGMVLRLELRSVRGGENDSDNAVTFSLQDDH